MRALVLLIMALFAGESYSETEIAAAECEDARAARLVSLQGSVSVEFNHRWRTAALDERLCEGSRLKVEANSRVSLQLPNGEILRLDKETVLSLNGISRDQPTALDLVKGFVHFLSRTPKRLTVTTPIANAGPEGTEFALRVDDTQAALWVYEGGVRFFNAQGSISLQPGQSAEASLGQAPRAVIDLRPADAVSWALYYPPLVAASPSQLSPSLQSALLDYRQGRIDIALHALDALPESRDSLKIRAALRLIVGRVEAAKQDVAALLAADPNDADALALQSVAALTQNAKDDALALARRAVAASPQSVPAQSALSYAEQSRFELNNALQAATRATELAPEDALVWARRAELEMANGLTDESLTSAQKASALDPNLERTQSVIGFAELARVNIDAARQHFETAVKLDSTAPLARLGLGLAKIRAGELEQGRADLEIAATLDPGNSLIRSYLGKAYYEERRDPLARDQFDLAKQRDPKDPTPYFYDAIRKQTTNRPVEALHDMQQAIELNDNRAVYRSELQLDQDSAARTANMARIYNDLGFGRVALKEAWKSLGRDATNPSAHRFLSDTYREPRFRVARASELLQAQLLQPINITPVQPQLTDENIGFLNNTGSGSISSNEYDPLYTSNGAHLVLNGAYGSRNTKSDTAVVSGVYDHLSMSFGQFHYQTDGFRENDDYRQDVYDVFAQYALTERFNIQLELKSEDIRSGDVPLRLDGYHAQNLRQAIEQDTARVGAHYKIDNKQDLVFSSFYTTRNDVSTDFAFVQGATPSTSFNKSTFVGSENNNFQTEFQYLYNAQKLDILSGVGYLASQSDDLIKSLSRRAVFPFDVRRNKRFTYFIPGQSAESYFNWYGYSKQRLLPGVLSTLGLSLDLYRDTHVELHQLNPKLGLTWEPINDLLLRGAFFRTLKRPLAANQTIEPTQVAGFNQFYDGINGSSAWQYSVGLDYKFNRFVYAGGEAIWRDISQIQSSFSSNVFTRQNRDEQSYIAYVYATPTDMLSLKAEYRYLRFDSSFIVNQSDSSDPSAVATHQVPISLNIYHPNGIYGRFTATWVNQQVNYVTDLDIAPAGASPITKKYEDFWTFDASVGFRMPKRLGTVSFEVRNLFDNRFGFQSEFDASGPQLSAFIPERQMFAKLTLFY